MGASGLFPLRLGFLLHFARLQGPLPGLLIAPPLAGLLGFWAALVFPLAWAVLDFATARLSTLGSWGSVAYTQHGNLPLMRQASVTDTPGITFMVTGLASVVNGAWNR